MMNKFELTKTDKTIANEAYKKEEHLRDNFKCIKVTYLDGVTKKFNIDMWLSHRNSIRTNLFKKGLCKIKPVKKTKIFGHEIF